MSPTLGRLPAVTVEPGPSVLIGSAYGQAIRRAERDRLSEPGIGPRIERRVYLYLPVEGGIPAPETGLGGNDYAAELHGMYDRTPCPMRLRNRWTAIDRREHKHRRPGIEAVGMGRSVHQQLTREWLATVAPRGRRACAPMGGVSQTLVRGNPGSANGTLPSSPAVSAHGAASGRRCERVTRRLHTCPIQRERDVPWVSICFRG